jgi:nucleotide-binding universal stress UspA family protein
MGTHLYPHCSSDQKASEAMFTINTILHPTDLSQSSNFAFVLACTLARENKARLVLLHVMPSAVAPLAQMPTPDLLTPAESQEAWKEAIQWPQSTEPKVVVEHRVGEGDAAEEILRLAEGENCDLIVMGTHGRTGLRRLLMGSVAEQVLRKALCPVMTVRIPPPRTQPAEAETMVTPSNEMDDRPFG